MSGNSHELIQQAIDQMRSGNKENARIILSRIVRQEPNNARAWFLLSQIAAKQEESQYCLEQVLRIIPNNDQAKNKLSQLTSVVTEKKEQPNNPPRCETHRPQIIEENGIKQSETITPTMTPQNKKCPYCGELINPDAIICRFCNRQLHIPENLNEPKITRPTNNNSKGLLILTILVVILLCPFFSSLLLDNKNLTTTTGYKSAKDSVELIDGFSCHHDSIGNMIIEGSVINIGNQDLTFVELRAKALTSSDQVVNTNTGFIDSDVLYAGSTSTYSIYVDDPNDTASRCEISIEDAYFK